MRKNDKNTWKFPETIEFSDVPEYSRQFDEIMKLQKKSLCFDLSLTKELHTSFIGFLIKVKADIEKKGGNLTLNYSEEVDKVLNHLSLESYFSTSKSIKFEKSA